MFIKEKLINKINLLVIIINIFIDYFFCWFAFKVIECFYLITKGDIKQKILQVFSVKINDNICGIN